MSDTTPRTALPLLAAAQAQKHVTHNEALLQLDALLFARFLDRDLTVPPASAADGDTYLVHAAATGDWAGKDGQVAFASDGAWRFYAPFTGLAAYVVDEARLVVFTGAAWADYASILSLQNVPLLGVNTTADATNKLAVKSAALLLDNIGNGVQAKLNKHASGDTASLLYQTNYSGRAEIGLCGDDDFHFKVSPDGATFYEGLRIGRANGAVDFLAGEDAIPSAATVNIGASTSLAVQITGTMTIASLGTAANKLRFVRFAGALTLTHNAASLILLGGASRTTAAGDVGVYRSDAGGNWRELSYSRAASNPGDTATRTGTETLTNKTLSGATLAGTTTLPGGSAINSSGSIGIGYAGLPNFPFSINHNGAVCYMDGNNFSINYYWNGASNVWGVSGGYGMAFGTNPSFGGIQFYLTTGTGTAGGSVSNQIMALNIDSGGNLVPGTDNTLANGSASKRWSTIYAGSGTINTSGAATKTNARGLSDAEIAVAKTLAANVRVFQFCDAMAKKGADARLHVGSIFEDVVAAFAAQGLDPMRYGIVCRDPQTTLVARVVTDASGVDQSREELVPDLDENGAQKWILGLRYDELAQFTIAGLVARLAALEA